MDQIPELSFETKDGKMVASVAEEKPVEAPVLETVPTLELQTKEEKKPAPEAGPDINSLTPEEQKVLDHMLIHPHPEAAFDLADELAYEPCSIYRIRARAISKLVRLRYGAGA